HQPHNLAPIRSIRAVFSKLLLVACFDTAFHRSHAAVADHFAIPQHLHAEGVRRYGFHGLSYEYIASRLPDVAPEAATGRVIVAHLGSGLHVCALWRTQHREHDGIYRPRRLAHGDPSRPDRPWRYPL